MSSFARHASRTTSLAMVLGAVLLPVLGPPARAASFQTFHEATPGLSLPSAMSGQAANNRFGSAFASADFNGDGYDDLAIGVPGEDVDIEVGPGFSADAGAVIILHGSSSGLRPQGNHSLFMTQDQAEFGHALAAADINGDGYADLVVGLPLYNDGTKDDAGAVAVAWGSAAGLGTVAELVLQDSLKIGNNSESNDRFGASLAMGDINADGFADLAIGTPGESFGSSGTDSGAVYVLYGASDGLQGANAPHGYQVFVETDPNLPHVAAAGNQYGYDVLLHDMDGDGDDELVVGAPMSDVAAADSGLVYIHHSNGSHIITLASTVLAGNLFGSAATLDHWFFGSSLSGGERSAPPGERLLLIGAPGYNPGFPDIFVGRAFLFRPGNSDDETVVISQQAPQSAEPYDEFGRSVLLLDLDNNGYRNERVVGVPGEGNSKGVVQLWGAPGWAQTVSVGQASFAGTGEDGDRFGQVLARGNFNGAQGEELVIGTPSEDVLTDADAGEVVVVSWDLDLIFADGFEPEFL